MTLDKNSLRADLLSTPGYIHLNSAGASLMPRCVLQTQLDHLKLEAEVGGYEAERRREAEIAAVYESVARLLNCRAQEIAIVENATVGWMMAFYSIPFRPGDRILTVESEYASNYLAYLQVVREKGVTVEVIPSDDRGNVCLDSLRNMIDERVRLISVTHIPTNGGLVNPVEEIGAIARQHGILYLVDACQSAGQMPLDVEQIGCDLLSATGRKFLRGPRGVGFLYVSQRILDRLHPPMIDLLSAEWTGLDSYRLREDARRFENWESSYSAKLGLGRAIDYALDLGLDEIAAEVFSLAAGLREMLAGVAGLRVHDIGDRRCGIVSFSHESIPATAFETGLREQDIHVSVSTPSSTLVDATRRRLPEVVRVSAHCFNRVEELERCVEVVERLAKS